MMKSVSGCAARRGMRALCSLAVMAAFGAIAFTPAQAGFTAKDAQILGRVLGFLDPAPPASVTLALVYDSPASQKEAEALAGQIAGKAGNFTLVPKAVKASDVGNSGANAILLMDGVSGAFAVDVVKAKKIPCFTSNSDLIKSGGCLISIKTDGKVEILVSGSLQKGSGVGFGAAFRMMITEV